MNGSCVTYKASEPSCVDVEAWAGELFDPLFPILDHLGEPVEITPLAVGSWSASGQVRRNTLATTVLHAWTTTGPDANARIVPGEAAAVLLLATPAETATWQTAWPSFQCRWSLDVTEPDTGPGDLDGLPTPGQIAAGAFLLHPQLPR